MTGPDNPRDGCPKDLESSQLPVSVVWISTVERDQGHTETSNKLWGKLNKSVFCDVSSERAAREGQSLTGRGSRIGDRGSLSPSLLV